MKRLHSFFLRSIVTSLLVINYPVFAEDKPVGLWGDVASITITVDGKPIIIERNQDKQNTINPDFALTSRPCPPFCIQPFSAGPGVETIGEREVLGYLQQQYQDSGEVVLVDARTPDWFVRGYIPGAVNVPWTQIASRAGATVFEVSETLVGQFGVTEEEGLLNFKNAKTIILYCNGPWCGQSPAAIGTLTAFGYPAHKLKYYRGGIQAWEMLGLTLIRPE